MTGFTLPFYVFNLYLTQLPGNKFVNLVITGAVQAFFVSFSGYLMNRLADMIVLRIIFFASVFCYMFFIFFTGVPVPLIYISNCIFIGCMGAWGNLGPLIAELRVPPQRLGLVNMTAQTVSAAVGVLVPFVNQLPGVWPLATAAIYQTAVYLAMFGLPEPYTSVVKA